MNPDKRPQTNAATPSAPKPDLAPDSTRSKPPRTPAQLEASRLNGAKSKGPSTPQGKRRSSQNAILHGLTATEHTLLMTEDPAQYKEVCDAFVDDLRPATKAELRLVEKIANLDWRLERLVMMETCVLNMEVGVNAESILERFSNIDQIGCIVVAWKDSLTTSNCLDLLRRYMGTLQHQFNTTLSNFQKFETRRLSRKHDRDLDGPYQRPCLETLDPEPEEDPGQQDRAPQAPKREDPDPQPARQQNEPEPANKPVTSIDIRSRQPSEKSNRRPLLRPIA